MNNPRSIHLLSLAAALVLFVPFSPLAAQSPFVVKDINPGGASAPTELVTMGGFTFFAADDGVNGVELWKSDGTPVGTTMVTNICPASCDSWPHELTVASLPEGDRLFFVANTTANGFELWKSDGSAGGTTLVKDIAAGANSSGVEKLTAVGDKLFFRAYDPALGLELWKSNGTAAGTVVVKDIAGQGGHSSPNYLVALGNTLYFSALGNGGRELWKSDGTFAGTVEVKDINPGGSSSSPARLTAIGNTLFFTAITGSGYELWKSDGTAGGTMQVKNIRPGFASSYPDHLTNFGGVLYFTADNGSVGAELWKSDGTLAGTTLVKDLYPGGTSSEAANLTVVGNLLFFSAVDSVLGRELWVSDGTGPGTDVLLDINTGAPDSAPAELRDGGEVLFFVADDGIAGEELWTSDGTPSGTLLVDDLIAGPTSSSPTEPTPTPSLLLFAANDGQLGRELWAFQAGGPLLGLTKIFNDTFVEAGTGNHTFALTVSNTGSAPATSVRITDAVDARLTVTAVSPASGECAASSGQFVDCTFPSLGPGAVEIVTVTYSVGGGVSPATVLNTAQAGDYEGELVEDSDSVDVVAPCTGDDHLDIAEETIYGTYLAEACISISAGPTVSVMPGANATLSAGSTVVLNDGFSVETGAILTISVN